MTGFGFGMQKSAVLSPCRTFRYVLTRVWDTNLPRLLFVLINPATADEKKEDRTSKRVIGFAKRWGFGSVVIVNLFAIRSPYPVDIEKADAPIGPDNDKHILEQAQVADKIVCGWGRYGSHKGRDKSVLALLSGFELFALKITKEGHPWHPLYIPYSQELVKYGS